MSHKNNSPVSLRGSCSRHCLFHMGDLSRSIYLPVAITRFREAGICSFDTQRTHKNCFDKCPGRSVSRYDLTMFLLRTLTADTYLYLVVACLDTALTELPSMHHLYCTLQPRLYGDQYQYGRKEITIIIKTNRHTPSIILYKESPPPSERSEKRAHF